MRAPSLILILFLCATCGSPQRESMGDIDADFESLKEMPMNAQPAPVTKVGNTQAVTKKLIKTGSIEFQSEDIEEDYHSIQALLPHFEAYLENESQSRSSSRITNNLTVRVPSENYDSLYHLLSDLAYRLENRYSNIEDATDRYYDLKTRIENKQVLEKRYLEILEQASMVKDILEVEKNLNEVRTEIEQLQGQFDFLSKQISLSTIHLSFYEVLPYVYDSAQRKGFGARILGALDSGWQVFLSFLVGLITLWPFLLLLAGLFFFIHRLRTIRKNKPKNDSEME